MVATIHRGNAGCQAVLSFLRYDDLTLIAMPWLPLLSGALFFHELGLMALVVVSAMLLYAYRVHAGRSDTRSGAVAIVGLLMVGFVTTSSLQQQSFVQVVQLILVALAIEVGPLLRFTRRARRICVASAVLLSLAGLLDLLLDGNLMFANANAYGVASLCWVSILAKLFWGRCGPLQPLRLAAILILPVALAVVSESRASLVAIAGLVTWPIVTAPFSSRKLRTVFGLFILLVPLAVIVLVAIGGLTSVQDMIPVIGEKSPFSGRDVIWFDIILELERNGYWGFGLGSLPGDILGDHYEGLSAHNGFLQVFYQFGVIGLVVFLSACALLIVALTRREDRGVSVAILGAALVHEVFEVVMIQNHFGSGLLLWLVVTLVPKLTRPVRSDRGLI